MEEITEKTLWSRLQLSTELATSLEKLKNSHVLIIGSGGLGNDISLRLAGCNISNITIVDGDLVSQSNIPHSTLFLPKHIGEFKVNVIRDFLQEKFPNIEIVAEPRFIQQCMPSIFESADVVICAPDNEQTRRWVNFYSVKYKKPALFVGVSGQKQAEWSGYTFVYKPNTSACFICLASGGEDKNGSNSYSMLTTDANIDEARNKCGGDNIPMPMLAPVVGILSSYAASLVLMYLSGVGDVPPYSSIDVKKSKITTYDIKPVSTCSVCGYREEFDIDESMINKLK